MTWPHYPEYVDSETSWLGKIPSHWTVGKLRNVLWGISNGTTELQSDASDKTIPVSRIETISDGIVNYERTGNVEWKEDLRPFLLESGDVLFSHINSLPMIGNCAIYRGERPLVHGMNLLRLRPRKIAYPRWLEYWLKNAFARQDMEASAKPAINQASISTSSVKSRTIPIPPHNEQRQIADFLDYETARIDALIEEQQRLSVLLREKRKVVISEAVSKGLYPETPMRHSAVEWLGNIPSHWSVAKPIYSGIFITTGNVDVNIEALLSGENATISKKVHG